MKIINYYIFSLIFLLLNSLITVESNKELNNNKNNNNNNIQDYNNYIRNWGFEDDIGYWNGDVSKIVFDNKAFHLFYTLIFGCNCNTSDSSSLSEIPTSKIITLNEQIVNNSNNKLYSSNNNYNKYNGNNDPINIIVENYSIYQSVYIPPIDLNNYRLILEFSIQLREPDNIDNSDNDIDFIIKFDEQQIFYFNYSQCNYISTSNYLTLSIDISKVKDFSKGSSFNLELSSSIKYPQNSLNSLEISIDNILIYKSFKNLINSNVYISSYGNDTSGDGSLALPFRTIQKGIDSIEENYIINVITDYEFQTNETVFNRGKFINLYGLSLSENYSNVTISDGYYGFFLVSTPTPYEISVYNSSNGNTCGEIINAQDNFIQNTLNQDIRPIFKVSYFNYELINENTYLNVSFSQTQYSTLYFQNNTLLTTLNFPYALFYISSFATLSIYGNYFEINSILEIFVYASLSNITIESSDFMCSSSSLLMIQDSNTTLSNVYSNGFLGIRASFYDMNIYSKTSIVDSSFTNVTFSGDPLLYFYSSINNNDNKIAYIRNLQIYDSDGLQIISSFGGVLIVDGLSITGISNIKFLLSIIESKFNLNNVLLQTIRFLVNPYTLNSLPCSRITGIGNITNLKILDTFANSEAPFLQIDDAEVVISKFTFKNSGVNLLSILSSNLTIDQMSVSNIYSGSIFVQSEDSHILLNQLKFNNNGIVLSDGSYNFTITNSIFSNNINRLTTISLDMLYSNFGIYIENTTFINNSGYTLVSSFNEQATFINVEFLSNYYCTELLVMYGDLYIYNLTVVNSTINPNQDPGCLQLYSLSSATILFSRFNYSSFPLNVKNVNSIQLHGVNINNAVGLTQVANFQNVYSGNWTNSIIQGSTLSLNGSSINILYCFGFVFKNVEITSSSSANYPFGIIVESKSIYFFGSTFSNSNNILSGGFQIYLSDVTFFNSNFLNNSLHSAVIVSQNSSLILNSCRFRNNIALDTSSVSLLYSQFTIYNCYFGNNILSTLININQSTGVINFSQFYLNTAPSSIILSYRANYTIMETLFQNTNYTSYGTYSSIMDTGSYISLESCNILDNLAFTTPTLSFDSSQVFMSTVVANNNTNIGGLGTFSFINCIVTMISNNFLYSQAHLGGVIYSYNSVLNLQDNYFVNNSASSGGAIFSQDSTLTMENNQFGFNKAANGFYSDLLDNNFYILNGGAIMIYDSNSSNNNSNSNSDDESNSGYSMDGSSSYGNNFNNFMNNSNFYYNKAYKGGGSIFIDSNSLTNIESTLFTNNTAYNNGGGAVFTYYPDSLISNDNIFEANGSPYGTQIASNATSLTIDFESNIQQQNPFSFKVMVLDYYNNIVTINDGSTIQIIIRDQNNRSISEKNLVPTNGESIFTCNGINSAVGSNITFYINLINQSDQKIFQSVLTKTIINCYTFQYLNDGVCQNCTPGTVGYNGNTCYSCNSDGLFCPDGVNIYWYQGYWFLEKIYNPPKLYACNPSLCQNFVCRENHQGTLCGQCVEGASKIGNFCIDCNETNYYIIAGYIIFIFLIIIILVSSSLPNRSIVFTLFTSLQLIGIISSNIENYTFFQIFNLRIDYISQFCTSPIFNYYYKYYIALGTNLFITVITTIIKYYKNNFIIQLIFYNADSRRDRNDSVKVKDYFISVSKLFFIPTIHYILSLYNCKNINEEDYLIYDPQVKCFTKSHFIAISISVPFIIYYLSILIYLIVISVKCYPTKLLFIKRNNSLILNSRIFQIWNTGSKEELEKEKRELEIQKKKAIRIQKRLMKKAIYFSHLKLKSYFWLPLLFILYSSYCVLSIYLITFNSALQASLLTVYISQFLIQTINPPFKKKSRLYFENIQSFIVLIAFILNNSRLLNQQSNLLLGFSLLSLSSFSILITLIYKFLKYKNYFKLKTK